MFKKLLSDKVISTLKKLPVWGWWIVYAAVAFFASAYDIVANGDVFTASFMETIASFNLSGYNGATFTVIYYLVEIIIPVLLFEFFAFVLYAVYGRRFFIDMNQKDFSFRLRIFFIIVNLCLGIISLPELFLTKNVTALNVIYVISADASIALRGLFLLGFFYEMSKKYFPGHLCAKSFLYISRIYLAIVGIIQIITLLTATVDGTNIYAIIENAVGMVFIAGLVVLAYFYWKKLKEIETEPPKPKAPEEKQDDVIFKDFGI